LAVASSLWLEMVRPPTHWTAPGGVVEILPGRLQFTDPEATSSPKRFYRAVAP
jgi:hypothetical protein